MKLKSDTLKFDVMEVIFPSLLIILLSYILYFYFETLWLTLPIAIPFLIFTMGFCSYMLIGELQKLQLQSFTGVMQN